jgi:hypothetical protein
MCIESRRQHSEQKKMPKRNYYCFVIDGNTFFNFSWSGLQIKNVNKCRPWHWSHYYYYVHMRSPQTLFSLASKFTFIHKREYKRKVKFFAAVKCNSYCRYYCWCCCGNLENVCKARNRLALKIVYEHQ